MARLDGWEFCPRCGGRIRNEGWRAVCASCEFVEYGNSAPAVQALIERDGRLLLARRAFDPGAGKWDLPGGFLDEGEEPLAGLLREVEEETGLAIEPGAFLGAFIEPYDGRFVLGLTWTAASGDGDPAADDDVAELRWFGPDELPAAAEFAFPHHPRLLDAWRQQQA